MKRLVRDSLLQDVYHCESHSVGADVLAGDSIDESPVAIVDAQSTVIATIEAYDGFQASRWSDDSSVDVKSLRPLVAQTD